MSIQDKQDSPATDEGMELPDVKAKKKNRDIPSTRKKNAGQLKVLVFEPEGGAPYNVEVTAEDGKFKLDKNSGSYVITRGSVWIEGGVYRTVVNKGNPQTVNIATFTGDDSFHPKKLDSMVSAELAEVAIKTAKTKPIWARGTTWGLAIGGVLLGLLLVWGIRTVGGGLEGIMEALENLKLQVQTASGGGGGGSHQDIAPAGGGGS